MRFFRVFGQHPFITVVVALMLAQAVALYLFIPVSSEASTGSQEKNGIGSVEPGKQRVEIAIGEFQARNFQTPGNPMLVAFRVCLIVDEEARQKLEVVLQQHQHRIHEAIGIALRKADLETLEEPSLATLKRRIRVAIFAAIRMDVSESAEVLVPDFTITRG